MFVFLVCAGGALCLASGVYPWQSSHGLLFLTYLIFAAIASGLKTTLPGFEGTVSVNFVFFLVGICNMTLSETLALAVVSTVVQCFWRAKKRMKLVHFVFNLSQLSLAISAAYWTYAGLFYRVFHQHAPFPLLAAVAVFFLLNSLPVAAVVALTENDSVGKKWYGGYAWTFAYYLIGAAIAGIVELLTHFAGWEISVLVLPAVYVIYRSYCIYLGRWEDEKRHLEDLAALNMRTIETLALAIEAKDHTTGEHLHRVRVYAMELGRDLGLSPDEMRALEAASVLHDIGKLAVPQHIISKPGKLTPEEFEKMKIHPVVGAEIVEQVRFPYPVAPIVHAHHEKWDGNGYPDGVSGEDIPIGARILTVVDCLDALASDRQYRRAFPLDEAMAIVTRDSGKAFDPRVVAALQARYIELEKLAKSLPANERPKLSLDIKIKRGGEPGAGFAESAPPAKPLESAPIPVEAIRRTGQSQGLEETLSAVALGLHRLVPFDAIAVFALHAEALTPCFALGENVSQLWSLQAQVGQGLIGWVAETSNYIINGNATVDLGLDKAQPSAALRAALAVPLIYNGRTVGVLAAYTLQPDFFRAEHLSVFQAGSQQLAEAVATAPRPKAPSDWAGQNEHVDSFDTPEARLQGHSVLTQ
jgi:putative nucleotidyltransferase with HDIG domain